MAVACHLHRLDERASAPRGARENRYRPSRQQYGSGGWIYQVDARVVGEFKGVEIVDATRALWEGP